MTTTKITNAEWKAALDEASQFTPPPSDAYSMRELAEMFGVKRETVARKVDRLIAEGKVKVTRKLTVRSNGSRYPVTAYLLTDKFKK